MSLLSVMLSVPLLLAQLHAIYLAPLRIILVGAHTSLQCAFARFFRAFPLHAVPGALRGVKLNARAEVDSVLCS